MCIPDFRVPKLLLALNSPTTATWPSSAPARSIMEWVDDAACPLDDAAAAAPDRSFADDGDVGAATR
jgi:hypothetical protein